MATFSLTKGGKTFDFDTSGEVKRGGNKIGKWTTSNNNDNKLVVTEDSGTQTTFDSITWKFNDKNQLELHDGGTKLLNLHGVNSVIPLYKAEDGALFVKPDRAKGFGFNLNGAWALNASHDLTIKLGTVTSTLDGFVEDHKSRFIYKFFSKAGTAQLFELEFAGRWMSINDDGKQIVKFFYLQNGKEQKVPFALLEGVTFDRSINQLVYDYDKNGMTRRLQFTGELKIGGNGVITYKLDRQKTGTGKDAVTSTTLQIQAAFNTTTASGDLEFVLVKNDGATPGTKLVIGGNFEKDLSGSKVKLGFRYAYEKSTGGVTENTLALNGEFVLKNNGTLVWSFSKNTVTKVTTITFAATDFRIGDFIGNLHLEVKTEDGTRKELKMLLGFQF